MQTALLNSAPPTIWRRPAITAIALILLGSMLGVGLPCAVAQPVAAAAAVPASASPFRSPTETPAAQGGVPAHFPLLAVAQAGRRLVAAGLRGRIVYSDDNGKTWQQAKVPVEVDLVAVNFPTPSHGWAVGHRGVVLESADSGATWNRRFAEQQLNELTLRHYDAQNPQPNSPAAKVRAQVARAMKEGAVPALLDVWFESPTSGTLVGTFNAIFRTEDGGQTWRPVMDRIDNPEELHFYAVRGSAEGLYLAGEKGGVWALDRAAGAWKALPTGYAGTLFGLVVDGSKVLAFGMRGSVFVSDDAGRAWQAVPLKSKVGLVTGTRLRDGRIVLADQAGQILSSKDGGRGFVVIAGAGAIPSFSLIESADGQLISAGPRGARPVSTP